MTPAVLIVTGQAWGSYLAVLKSLGRKGVPVHVLSWGVDQGVLRRSRYYFHGREFPVGSSEAMVRDMLTYGDNAFQSEKPALFYCTDKDAMFVARNKSALEDRYTVLMGDADTCLAMMAKDTAQEVVEQHGLTVPGTWDISSRDDVEALLEKCEFPLMLKPTMWETTGGVPIKADKILSPEVLRETACRVLAGGGRLVAQEFIEGGDECVEFFLFYRSADGRRMSFCTGRKLRQFPPGAGVMALGVTDEIEDLRVAGTAFVEGIGFVGLGGLEFKRNNGKLYFIEMSVRSEMFHKIAMDAGVDLPWAAYADASGLEWEADQKQRNNVFYLNEFQFAVLLWKDFRQTVRDLLQCRKGSMHFCLLTTDDPMPFAVKSFKSLRKLFGKLY